MGRRLSLLLSGSMVLAGSALLAPPAAVAATNDLFGPYTATMPGSSPANVAVGDVTGDGLPDVVMTTGYSSDAAHDFSLFVYPQQADGSLGAPTQVATGAAYGSHLGIALADLDGDGDLDAAVTTKAGVLIYRQTAGRLAYAWTVPVQDGQDVRLVDVSGDGLADLVVNAPDGIHVWWQVKGDMMRSPAGEMVGAGSHVEVEAGDVNGDGRTDLVAATGTGVEVYLQQADQSFAAAATYPSGVTGSGATVNALAVGDTNGDGVADVHLSVGGNKPNAWVVTRYATPTGTLGSPVVRASGDIPEALEVGDVTGDGRNDLVVVHGGWNELGVYDSTPGIDPSEVLYYLPYASHYETEGLALGDVSGDGRLDALVADYNHGLVELRSAAPGADTTAPDTTITSAPPSTLRSRSATFAFTANEPATFSCSMDAAAWAPCTSPATYDGLAQGSHRFQVRATDTAGNVETMAAAASFTVDGPDTTITSGPSGTVASASATFAFTGGQGTVSFQCALDNDPWTACASPMTYTGLATGTSHAFQVRAVSADGLVDSTPAFRSWKVDGPDTTITSGPSGTVRSTSATFAFSAAANAATFQCALDDGAWTACTSPTTYTGLATGTSHAFKVRAVAADGTADSTPAVRSWVVDSAADVAVTLSAAPSPVKKNGTLTWTATVTDAGPQSADAVTLTEGLPSGFSLGSVTAVPSAPTSAAGSCSASGSPATVRCTLGTVNPGLTWTVTVTGKVSATKGSLAATAVGGTSSWDLLASNDSASAAVSVASGR